MSRARFSRISLNISFHGKWARSQACFRVNSRCLEGSHGSLLVRILLKMSVVEGRCCGGRSQTMQPCAPQGVMCRFPNVTLRWGLASPVPDGYLCVRLHNTFRQIFGLPHPMYFGDRDVAGAFCKLCCLRCTFIRSFWTKKITMPKTPVTEAPCLHVRCPLGGGCRSTALWKRRQSRSNIDRWSCCVVRGLDRLHFATTSPLASCTRHSALRFSCSCQFRSV